MIDRRLISSLLTLATLLLLGATAPALAGPNSHCYTGDVPSDIVLPDGSQHAAGKLKICLSRSYSPVTSLLETYVGGMPVGLYPGTVETARATEAFEAPFFLFYRNADGALELQGYAIPDGDSVHTYNMSPDGNEWNKFEVESRWELASLADGEGGATILIAADRVG